MTKAAQHFGKRLQHFWDNTDTASYVVALAVAISRDSGELKLKEEDRDLFSYFRSQHTLGVRVDVSTGDAKRILPLVLDVRRGSGVNGGGTWAHPKLAVFFARWLDVRFAVWCDLMVDEILRGRLEVQPVAAPVTQDRGLEDVVKAMLPVLLPEVVRMVAKIAPKDATGPRGGGITAINPQSSP